MHSNLIRGTSTKCGECASLESRGVKNILWTGGKFLPGSYISSLKNSAKSRGIPFRVSIKILEEAWNLQGGKCAYTGLQLSFSDVQNARKKNYEQSTASIDRIDSRIGYIEKNIQWVHKDVNLMKMALPESRFLELCKLVADKK